MPLNYKLIEAINLRGSDTRSNIKKMKASKFLYFIGSWGSQSKGQRFLKYSTLGIISIAIINKMYFFATRNKQFEHRIKLVFPQYNQDQEETKKVQIVSENQLEYVIKQCSIHGKAIRCLNDHAISAFKGINVIIDYS